MCILFVYVADKPTPETYKLILAVNRDEYYNRPTSPANFWKPDFKIVGGIDNEPGREGGTWLAMSKLGKIGVVLNVLESKSKRSDSLKGRGFLVNNFLNSRADGLQYLNKIYETSTEYKPFNLLTIDSFHEKVPQVHYFSCVEKTGPQKLRAGVVHGISNSYITTPFRKVQCGKEAVAKVIEEKNNISTETELIEGILDILKNQKKYHPDPQIFKQGSDRSKRYLKGVSSIFIKLPDCGTRTHTIILVDYYNNIHYRESTMDLDEPVNESNPTWSTSSFHFQLKLPQTMKSRKIVTTPVVTVRRA